MIKVCKCVMDWWWVWFGFWKWWTTVSPTT